MDPEGKAVHDRRDPRASVPVHADRLTLTSRPGTLHAAIVADDGAVVTWGESPIRLRPLKPTYGQARRHLFNGGEGHLVRILGSITFTTKGETNKVHHIDLGAAAI